MTSRISLIALMTAALTAGGLMADQGNSVRHRDAVRGRFFDRMSTTLNLTDQQKEQAKTIFKSERESARSAREQLRQERKAVQAAIQAGKPEAEVEQLAKNEGPALGDLAGMRAAAFAKFYGILTPEQQQKLASLHQERQHRHSRAENPAENR
jgi:Spy/CpxP family protein refolding chaperone